MAARDVHPHSLAHRYAVLLCGIALVLLLASGLSEMWFGYRGAREQIAALQAAQAEAAAREIALYLQPIELALRDTAKLPWGRPDYPSSQQRDELYRLMQMTPAIIDIQVVDTEGRERLYVSKRDDDRVDSLRPVEEAALLGVSRQVPVRYGRTFFHDLSPSLHVAAWNGTGAILATVDLRLLGDVVAHVRAGPRGRAWIVDGGNLLIAHPQATQVLRQLDLSGFDAVRFARSAAWGDAATVGAHATLDLQGQPVLVTAARVAGPDWLVFVEQPRAEALGPALATLKRTLVLVVFGGCLALGAGLVVARRMAAPIVALRAATARIAGGDLVSRIEVGSGDEIEGVARDFNQMAASLRESYADLEAKVVSRTVELSEARDRLERQAAEVANLNLRLVAQLAELAQRRDEAERANAAKSRFLATASHDLRQPMHSIGLLVDVLRDRLGGHPLADLAVKVQASVATMESLFGSLLDISKLDARAVRPEFGPVELDRLLERVERTFAPQAQARGLRLRTHARPLVARSDAALLERIVNNLVSNAIRYTSDGGVLVACRARAGACVLQVWDTGRGITPEHQAAVFEEFFRIEAPGASSEKGLGLGLSIVQRSAEILGHALAVRSRPGHGSVFELTLERLASAPGAQAIRALPYGADALAGAFVAVVDDDEDNRQAIANLLRSWGCPVLDAASAEELVARSGEHLRMPDVLVTDFQLGPGRDGFEAIARLRAHHDVFIPAVVVTANTDGALAARAAVAGATLLHKPAGGQRLLWALVEALQRGARQEDEGAAVRVDQGSDLRT
jgi:signal transduction histidine kinase/CheY-like chemotaxis protein